MAKKMKNKKSRKGGEGVVKMGQDKIFLPFEDKCWYKSKFVGFDTGKGRYGELFYLKFEMLNGEMEDGSDAKGQECRAMTSQDLTPKSKLCPFVVVFEGGEIDEDDVIDLNAYCGQKVMAFVESSNKEKEDGTPYQNVTAIKKMKAKKSKSKKKKKK